MKITKFKSKIIRGANKYFRIKPTTLAEWMDVSLATIYRHIASRHDNSENRSIDKFSGG